MKWYLEALRKYAVFAGRARRREYWMFTLWNTLIAVSLYLATLGAGKAGFTVYMMYACAMLPPGLAVAVRRLHDTGRSGWWMLLALIPLFGSLALVWFLCQGSQAGNNRHGPNPKAPGF